MNIIFLGTGTSHGVPSIDCMLNDFATCPKGVCAKAAHDPRHRRTRSSVCIQHQGQTILIDAGPDFREQMLREKIKHIDTLLLTHKHADHIGGIPDIRSYTRSKALDVYGSAETIDYLHKSYSYIFDPATTIGGGIPQLRTHAVQSPFTLGELTITPLSVQHGSLSGCYGYRIGPLAYIPDIKVLPPATAQLLKGVECLILNCLRIQPEHCTHLILSQSLHLAKAIAPRRCYFIHMCHDIDYLSDKHMLDDWIDFAWDGLRIEC